MDPPASAEQQCSFGLRRRGLRPQPALLLVRRDFVFFPEGTPPSGFLWLELINSTINSTTAGALPPVRAPLAVPPPACGEPPKPASDALRRIAAVSRGFNPTDLGGGGGATVCPRCGMDVELIRFSLKTEIKHAVCGCQLNMHVTAAPPAAAPPGPSPYPAYSTPYPTAWKADREPHPPSQPSTRARWTLLVLYATPPRAYFHRHLACCRPAALRGPRG